MINFEENFGLVHLCAKRFGSRGEVSGCDYDDVFQAGCVGLIKAAENFDETRGVRFSTYAVPVILGEMRALFRSGGSVRVSRTIREQCKKAGEAADELRASLKREPTVEEIAQKLQMPAEKVSLALGALRPAVSLTDSEDGVDVDISTEALEEKITERLTLYRIISDLDERDRLLITLRYYLGRTQTQTAERLGMTQVQVSRREKKLITYMREKFEE